MKTKATLTMIYVTLLATINVNAQSAPAKAADEIPVWSDTSGKRYMLPPINNETCKPENLQALAEKIPLDAMRKYGSMCARRGTFVPSKPKSF